MPLSLPTASLASIVASENDEGAVICPDSSAAFMGTRPGWTCSGALLQCEVESARVAQTPFRWVNGAWQAEVTIHPIEPQRGRSSVTLTARVTPDTLRRWASVGINPFLEARAQLQDHWRRTRVSVEATLTWL